MFYFFLYCLNYYVLSGARFIYKIWRPTWSPLFYYSFFCPLIPFSFRLLTFCLLFSIPQSCSISFTLVWILIIIGPCVFFGIARILIDQEKRAYIILFKLSVKSLRRLPALKGDCAMISKKWVAYMKIAIGFKKTTYGFQISLDVKYYRLEPYSALRYWIISDRANRMRILRKEIH